MKSGRTQPIDATDETDETDVTDETGATGKDDTKSARAGLITKFLNSEFSFHTTKTYQVYTNFCNWAGSASA